MVEHVPANTPTLEDRVWDALRHVIDPELQMNIVDLGLVYGVEVWPDSRVQVTMTMTTPACPLSAYIKRSAEVAIQEVLPPQGAVQVNVVWSPAWSPAMISPEGLKELERMRG